MSDFAIAYEVSGGGYVGVSAATPLPVNAVTPTTDPSSQTFVNSAAYTPSDVTTTTAGRGLAIVATVAGNVSVLMSGGGTFVFPVIVGLTIVPLAVTRVNTTGTTAVATYSKLT